MFVEFNRGSLRYFSLWSFENGWIEFSEDIFILE